MVRRARSRRSYGKIGDCEQSTNAAGSKLKAINLKGGGKTRCSLRLSAIEIDSENEVSRAIMNKTRTTDLFFLNKFNNKKRVNRSEYWTKRKEK